MEKNLILVYTGNGKGKTSACLGQCLRALGQNLNVAFAQFMKRDEQAGEQVMLHKLLGANFFVGGIGFFRQESERALHREAALNTLSWLCTHIVSMDMLILDESLYALHAKLLEKSEIENLMQLACTHNTHLVFSGRNAPSWLIEQAHLVSEIQEIKHPWQQGIKASKGIEF